MKTKKLGINGPEVSSIAIGSRAVSEMEGAKQQTIKTLQTAIDLGVNFINTADFYGMGLNELHISEAIKGRRDQVFLSVKTGSLRDPNGRFIGLDCRPESIKNFCSYSLTRLGVDVIDLYQPARVDPNVPIEETVGAIKDLIQEGKVRYLGLSEANADQLKRAYAVHPVSALEIEYSLATRFIENEIMPTARQLGVSIVPYSVLSYGLLSGNTTLPLADNDYRRIFPRFQGENFEYNLKLIEILKNLAEQKGTSAGSLALAWVYQQGEDIIPIVGMSRPERVEDNLKALDIEFTVDEMNLLNETFKIGALKGDRYPAMVQKWAAS